MSQSNFAISVVMPSFNCGEFLGEAITSALRQSPGPAEILVIDDGSTDETPTVVATFGDRVRLVSIPHSGRPATPRNVGLRLATSDIVAFHDADDVMLPGKLGDAAGVFSTHPEVAMLFTDFQQIDERGELVRSSYLREYRAFRAVLRPSTLPDVFLAAGGDIFEQLLRANFIGTPGVVVRRDLVVGLGGFDESLANGDDVDLWYRLSRSGPMMAFVDRPSFAYRMRSGSVTSRGTARYPAMIRVLTDQLRFVNDPATRRTVEKRLAKLTLGYAYELRQDGDGRRALAVCLGELLHRPSWAALRGAALACPSGLAATLRRGT